MTLPNRLTVGRLILCAILVFILEIECSWRGTVAFFIFVIAGITDWLDGYLARKFNQQSDLGKLLDPLADKVMISIAFVWMASSHLAPEWIVVCVIAREFLITGLRGIAASKGVILAAEKIGKHKTISQIITSLFAFLILALRDLHTFPEIRKYLITFVLNPMLALTLVVTVYSGIVYFIKNRKLVFEEHSQTP